MRKNKVVGKRGGVTNGMLYVVIILLFAACSTSKVTKPSPIQKIQYGSGGGFAGNVTTYTLKADGTLWLQEKQIAKLSCDDLSSLLELAEQLPNENYVRPSNTYYFVQVILKDTTYYWSWNAGNLPDPKVTELYIKLNKR